MTQIHLILGGARSGKSSYAEKIAITRAEQTGKDLVYLATAQANDQEMADRIAQHQQDRSDKWQTIECPIALTDTLMELMHKPVVILVDCLTLWLTNHLCQQGAESWHQTKRAFNELLTQWDKGQADLWLVSNEVGHGIVPLGELSRQFVDESGWLHQDIAGVAETVDFIMAGLPLNLKKNGRE